LIIGGIILRDAMESAARDVEVYPFIAIRTLDGVILGGCFADCTRPTRIWARVGFNTSANEKNAEQKGW
jgi:hypothetical protein